jgi:FHA domain
MTALPALIEVLDRDGQVRQSHAVGRWPLRIGRALDNDIVLSDPHVAPQHLRVDTGEAGLELQVGETYNGVIVGHRRLRAGERLALVEGDAPAEWTVGRTHLRLRLPGQALAPELPLAAAATRTRRFAPLLLALVVLLAALTFNTWLETDPDNLARSLGGMLMATAMGAAIWCGLWALLSKTFTRQTWFGWHLKVFLLASIAWLLCDTVPSLLGFALSWPWISDFGFVATYAVGAAALYYHLLAVEPARPRLLRSVAVVAFVVGVGLSLWFNQQRSDRLGAELYMSHLFPPALRLARPVSADRFIEGTAPLQAVLDKRAKEPPYGDGGSGGSDDE